MRATSATRRLVERLGVDCITHRGCFRLPQTRTWGFLPTALLPRTTSHLRMSQTEGTQCAGYTVYHPRRNWRQQLPSWGRQEVPWSVSRTAALSNIMRLAVAVLTMMRVWPYLNFPSFLNVVSWQTECEYMFSLSRLWLSRKIYEARFVLKKWDDMSGFSHWRGLKLEICPTRMYRRSTWTAGVTPAINFSFVALTSRRSGCTLRI